MGKDKAVRGLVSTIAFIQGILFSKDEKAFPELIVIKDSLSGILKDLEEPSQIESRGK